MKLSTSTEPTSLTRPRSLRPEIHQHDVLGPLFLVGEKLFGQGGVFRLRIASPAGPGDGAGHNPASFDPDEGFRGGADEGEAAELQVGHVGRRVYRAQAAVEEEGVEVSDLGGEPLGGDDLERVPCSDVLLRSFYRLLVAFPGEVGGDLEPRAEGRRPAHQRGRETLRDPANVVGGPPVGGGEALALHVA